MFLSTENPPLDPLTSPPSPSSLLHLITSSDELGQSHLQNFSIRDYAYSNRRNNIKKSWPFSPKSLQLCSTHGVTDPLPPFQKVSNASNKFETTASSSSGKQIVCDLAKLKLKGGYSKSRIIIKNGFGTSKSVSKSKVETIVTSTSNNKNYKKCGRGGMVKSKEDTTCGGGGGLVMTTTTTCPICKTFTSASNTTLNAHIDQCLSVDSSVSLATSSTKPNKDRVNHCLSIDSVAVITKPNKPRVNQYLSEDAAVPPVSTTKPNKPRMKVKKMVDIYASAKGCTLEDLDKRNGTKWASTVLSKTNQVVADKSEVSKKRKVSPVGVGPVYIDDKGQKLRILTEFNEKKTSTTTTTTTPLREQHKDSISEKKSSSQRSKGLGKRRGGKKHYKYLKLTNLKANQSEIHECQRVFNGEGSSKGHRRIYNQRMLSKRGLMISKKLNEKEHKFYALRDQPSEDDDDDDDSWSGEESIVLNKQKEAFGRNNKTMFGGKGDQRRSFRVQMSEKKEKCLARTHLDTVKFKKRHASIQEEKYPLGKNVREVASSMRKLSAPPIVANGWRRQSLPVELKKARLDSSEEEEEETGKWESEMTQKREVSDDDYVDDDNSPSFSRYDDDDDDDDDDEESNDEEEEDDSNTRANDATPSNETIPSERPMGYYSEEVEEMIYEQTTCDEDVRFDSEVIRGKGSLFVEVDNIPIPGPPGSFLPSPRDMCYDENIGNSSVITSQIQSFDTNSSESPVSNFASGRLSFCVPSHHETVTVNKTEPPPGFRSNDHESCCCCQRKDRISEGIALNHHQTSHLLQRRAEAYSSRLDTNHPFEQQSIQQDLDLQSKFSNRAVVVPPPSPNPVLRLMGKDLMVMNQVEASKDSLKPTTQFLDPPPCAGTGLYFNAGLYLRNSFESAHQPQTQYTSFISEKQF